LKYFLAVTELGLILLDERLRPVSAFRFEGSEQETAKHFLEAASGNLPESALSEILSKITSEDSLATEESLVSPLAKAGIKTIAASPEQLRQIGSSRTDLMVNSGLAKSKSESEEAVRSLSLYVSSLRIKEMSSKPDLQAMESVQALDEIDKTANIVSSRVREWYGLHFPELSSMIDDNQAFVKIVQKFKSRQNYDADELEQIGYSKNKSKAIVTAAEQSRGADLRDEDVERIVQLSEEAEHLFSLRDKLASHVERTMRQAAPNVSAIAGATIGARLIARAGGLQRLSILPASTIQVLGAEKALYRALKTGSRPPKHGILFQHSAVHSAPKWQRGKIARTVAGKIAIAARVDEFRGTRDESVERSLESRLGEIKTKYSEAPKIKPQTERKKFANRVQDQDRAKGGRERSRFRQRKSGHDRRENRRS
jgi:nucleolar protein 56